jgi:hypothetical protein
MASRKVPQRSEISSALFSLARGGALIADATAVPILHIAFHERAPAGDLKVTVPDNLNPT